ncbi:hypothetical protein OBV_26940 [Oscillibacter valericigenes Sjm18-20]|nr:hypothetical protein OBV_26940 [Oscillibacter valericigenes Sjm18-20]
MNPFISEIEYKLELHGYKTKKLYKIYRRFTVKMLKILKLSKNCPPNRRNCTF